MGLKSIELQVAIPRSQDAGKMQEQMTKQGDRFQETLTQQQLREDFQKRMKINRFEHVKDKNISDKEDAKKERDHQERKDEQANDQDTHDKPTNHPYLGTRIDYSG